MLEATKDLISFNITKDYLDKITNSELVAQVIVTELLNSEEFKANLVSATNNAVNKADKKMLVQILETNGFNVTEQDKQIIQELLKKDDISSSDYIKLRNKMLDKYYSSTNNISDIHNVLGLIVSSNDIKDIGYISGKHASITDDSILDSIKVIDFGTQQIETMISTYNDIRIFNENAYALATTSYAMQEALCVLKSNLFGVFAVERYQMKDTLLLEPYTNQITAYIEKLQKAVADNTSKYFVYEKMKDSILTLFDNTAQFVIKEVFIDEPLKKVCPEVALALKIPGMTLDMIIVIGGFISNVDERLSERNYLIAESAVVKSLALGFMNNKNNGTRGYFTKIVINDQTEYSVEVYEAGLALFKHSAKLYESHAEKYLAMLMDSDDCKQMAETILLAEDYEDYKNLSIFDDKKKPVVSQLVVDSYSLNIWSININNIICHTEYDSNSFVDPVTKKKYYLIACPINVSIINNNAEVANIMSDKLNILEDDYNVQIFTFIRPESDTLAKAVLVPYNYDVILSGYDDGTMNIQKSVIDNGNIIDYAKFDNIPVSDGMQYKEVIDEDNLIAINGYYDEADGLSMGDVNDDGYINVTDIAIVAAHVKGIRAIAETNIPRADVNKDGDVNVTDIALIAAHVKGIRSLTLINIGSKNDTDSKNEEETVEPVVPSSISLNQTSYTLYEGDMLELTATISPDNAKDKSVTWSSSDTSVATVSNGKVTAISEGKVTISVKTVNNKTAFCSLTVRKPQEEYIKIYTANDFNNIRNNLSGKYVLMNDIDLTGFESWVPIGDAQNGFNGVIDGNNHTVTYQINESASAYPSSSIVSFYYGLIGYAHKNSWYDLIEIKNLNVCGSINTNISSYDVSTQFIGGLVGRAEKINIRNCCSNVVVNTKSYIDTEEISVTSYVGGIIGWSDGCNIENCINNEKIDSKLKTGYSGCHNCGGICGVAANSTIINNCENYGEIRVSTDSKIIKNNQWYNVSANGGGIAGSCGGGAVIIENCYSNCHLEGYIKYPDDTIAWVSLAGIAAYGEVASYAGCSSNCSYNYNEDTYLLPNGSGNYNVKRAVNELIGPEAFYNSDEGWTA